MLLSRAVAPFAGDGLQLFSDKVAPIGVVEPSPGCMAKNALLGNCAVKLQHILRFVAGGHIPPVRVEP